MAGDEDRIMYEHRWAEKCSWGGSCSGCDACATAPQCSPSCAIINNPAETADYKDQTQGCEQTCAWKACEASAACAWVERGGVAAVAAARRLAAIGQGVKPLRALWELLETDAWACDALVAIVRRCIFPV